MSASNINAIPNHLKKVKTGSKQPSQKKMPHKVQKQNQQPIQSTLALLEKQLALEIDIKSKLRHEKPHLTSQIIEQDKETQQVIGKSMSALRIGTQGLNYVDSKPSRVMKKVYSKQEGAATPSPIFQTESRKKSIKELKLMPCHLKNLKKSGDSKEEKKFITIQKGGGGGGTQAYRKNAKKSQLKKEVEFGSLSGRNIKQVEITLAQQSRQKKAVYSANCTPHNELAARKSEDEYMSPTAKKHFKIKEAIRKDKMKKQTYLPLASQESGDDTEKYYVQDTKRSRQAEQETLPRAFSDEQMGWVHSRRKQQNHVPPQTQSVEKEEQRLDRLLQDLMKETQLKINLFHKEKQIEFERTQRLSTIPVPEDEDITTGPIKYQPNLVNRVIAQRAENAFRTSTRRLVNSATQHRQTLRKSVLAEPQGQFESEPDSEPFS